LFFFFLIWARGAAYVTFIFSFNITPTYCGLLWWSTLWILSRNIWCRS
jgi:hypothetical protein